MELAKYHHFDAIKDEPRDVCSAMPRVVPKYPRLREVLFGFRDGYLPSELEANSIDCLKITMVE